MNYTKTKIDKQGRITMIDQMDTDNLSDNSNNLGS